jgi:hypothetical protein
MKKSSVVSIDIWPQKRFCRKKSLTVPHAYSYVHGHFGTYDIVVP